jgi:hypothetical protein
VVRAVAAAVPAFLVLAARIRREEYAAGPQRGVELTEYARHFAARHVEERRVGEDAVECGVG